MAMKDCPICGSSKSTSDMFYCSHCNLMFCKSHVATSGMLGTKLVCPKCHREVR